MTSLIQDLFAGDEEEARRFGFQRPPKHKFAPWHKARKQFIRAEHWGAEIRNLLAVTGISSPVRYFGLPGHDLLDLRYFISQYFVTRAPKLRFTGFDRFARESDKSEGSESASAAASLASLRRMPGVDNHSEVFDEELALIGDPDSLANERFTSAGPFDVINLDLMGGVAKNPNGAKPSMYDALDQIFTLQMRQKRPWLLFLTTRYDSQNVHQDAIDYFGDLLVSNLKSCEPFTTEYHRHFTEHIGFAAPWNLDTTALGICKWLVHLAAGIDCKADIRWLAKYRVQDLDGEPDMLSLVLWLTPHLQGAGTGQIGAAPHGKVVECQEVKQIPGKVRYTLDVDEVIHGDSQARDRAVSETIDLLVATGKYKAKDYLEWRAAGEPTTQLT